VGFTRDATQDCTTAPASATTATASFPGGACEKGRLIVAVAQVPAFTANVSVKGGAGFTVAKSQDHGSAGSLIGAVFISAGTETGVTFTHSSAAGQMRVFGFQYITPLSPVSVDIAISVTESSTTSAAMTAGGNVAAPDELQIGAASLLGTGASPASSSGTIIGNSGNGLYVSQRILPPGLLTPAETISWTGSIFRVGILFTIKASPVGLLGTGFSA
jgi:hypothetical protein